MNQAQKPHATTPQSLVSEGINVKLSHSTTCKFIKSQIYKYVENSHLKVSCTIGDLTSTSNRYNNLYPPDVRIDLTLVMMTKQLL